MYQTFRLTRQDFLNAQPPSLLEDMRPPGAGCVWEDVWAVAPAYELLDVPAGPYLAATPPAGRDEWDHWREYVPLRDEPDLFLKFARLGECGLSTEGEFSTEAVREWVGRYGLLGCGEPGEDPETGMNAGWFGRTEDNVATFVDEARRAATAVAWYEAVASGDEDLVMETIMGDPVVDFTYPRPNQVADLSEYQLSVLGSRFWRLADHYDDVEEPFVALAVDYLTHETNMMIRRTCYRQLKPLVFEDDARRVVGAWCFTSLLGAMYLQLSWLMEAGVLRKFGGSVEQSSGVSTGTEAGG